MSLSRIIFLLLSFGWEGVAGDREVAWFEMIYCCSSSRILIFFWLLPLLMKYSSTFLNATITIVRLSNDFSIAACWRI